MAKKQQKMNRNQTYTTGVVQETRTGQSFKEMLNEDALARLKQLERDVKAAKEREEQEAVERKRREQEEKERNKSFAELLNEYEKKGGGKYS
ncbi:YqkE family protein [Brevibacillus sp. H7]|uniref:YqkE family protein n=1 Tax=Brevibacillus sp. H7 TaxID=3349138 RepID=UPI0038225C5E